MRVDAEVQRVLVIGHAHFRLLRGRRPFDRLLLHERVDRRHAGPDRIVEPSVDGRLLARAGGQRRASGQRARLSKRRRGDQRAPRWAIAVAMNRTNQTSWGGPPGHTSPCFYEDYAFALGLGVYRGRHRCFRAADVFERGADSVTMRS